MGMQKWKGPVLAGDKTVSRRCWTKATIKRFERLCANGVLVSLGGQLRESQWALAELVSVRQEKLSDFPVSDVVLEGGKALMTPMEFIASQPELRKLHLSTLVT